MRKNTTKGRNTLAKVFSVLMSMLLVFGMSITLAPEVNADGGDKDVIEVAQFIKTENDTYTVNKDNDDVTFKGTYKAVIPVKSLIEPRESLLEDFGNAYPHGRLGKNKIAFVRFNSVFPEGTVLGDITYSSDTNVFPQSTIKYQKNNNAVNWTLPLTDQNWHGILNAYRDNKDGKVEVTIPYSYTVKVDSATSLDALKNESNKIVSSGDFAFYPSGFGASLGFGLKEFFTDKSELMVTNLTDFSEIINQFYEEAPANIVEGVVYDKDKQSANHEKLVVNLNNNDKYEVYIPGDNDHYTFEKFTDLLVTYADNTSKKFNFNHENNTGEHFTAKKGSIDITIDKELFDPSETGSPVKSVEVEFGLKHFPINFEMATPVAKNLEELKTSLDNRNPKIIIANDFGVVSKDELKELKLDTDYKNVELVNENNEKVVPLELNADKVKGKALKVASVKDGKMSSYDYKVDDLSKDKNYAFLPALNIPFKINRGQDNQNYYGAWINSSTDNGESGFYLDKSFDLTTYNGGKLGEVINDNSLFPAPSDKKQEVLMKWVYTDGNKTLTVDDKTTFTKTVNDNSASDNSIKFTGDSLNGKIKGEFATKLDGDLRIKLSNGNTNTEHENVFLTNDKKINVQATLNVKKVFDQLEAVAETYMETEHQLEASFPEIKLYTDFAHTKPGVVSNFTATFELPKGLYIEDKDLEGLKFENDSKYNLFKIDEVISKEINGDGTTKVTVKMSLDNYNYNKDYSFQDLFDAVKNNSPQDKDGYVVTLPVSVGKDAPVDKNLTIKGHVDGTFNSYAEYSKIPMPFKFDWHGVQQEAGVDYILNTAPHIDQIMNTWLTISIPKPINIQVEKVWDDADNQDGIRPDNVEVEVKGTVGETTVYTDTIQLNKGNSWKHEFKTLPAYKDGMKIEYSVIEKDVPKGYDVIRQEETIDSNTTKTIITNTHKPDVKNITVNKVWKDDDNKDNLRPEKIKVTLMNGDKEVKSIEIAPNDDNQWVGTFEGLAAKENGEAIKYTVKEEAVNNYKSEITGDVDKGFTITNTLVQQPVPPTPEPPAPTPEPPAPTPVPPAPTPVVPQVHTPQHQPTAHVTQQQPAKPSKPHKTPTGDSTDVFAFVVLGLASATLLGAVAKRRASKGNK